MIPIRNKGIATHLIEFHASDGIKLSGLLYLPKQKTSTVVISLHGTGGGSVFYATDRTNTMGAAFAERGVAFLPFNNRGAGLIQPHKQRIGNKTKRVYYGSGLELIKDAVLDIDGAVAYARSLGYTRIFLAGASTGANKICVYHASSIGLRPRAKSPRNRVTGYILLGGGDDTGLLYTDLGKRKFYKLLDEVKKKVKAGHGDEVVPFTTGVPKYMTWQALYDMANPDGLYNCFPFREAMRGEPKSRKPLFHLLKKITKPSLVLYGSEDEYCYGDVPRVVELLKDAVRGKKHFTFMVLQGADHSYHKKEKQLTRMMHAWMHRV
ncbi:MAG: DUF1749 domain-containing protein [Patescibacteria group bacterium]|jgi:pimeloyl-ACP methyl ester carboxylesterase